MDQKQIRDRALTGILHLKWWQHFHVRLRGQTPPPEVAFYTVRANGSPPKTFAVMAPIAFFWTAKRDGVIRFSFWAPFWKWPAIYMDGGVNCTIEAIMHAPVTRVNSPSV